MIDRDDTQYQHEPTCPRCGHKEIHDLWDHDWGMGCEGSAEFLCSKCEYEYEVHRSVTFYYSSNPIPQPTKEP